MLLGVKKIMENNNTLYMLGLEYESAAEKVRERLEKKRAKLKSLRNSVCSREAYVLKSEIATLYGELKEKMSVQYDEKGAVGRRYRRQDEIGTPYCVTVDGQTLQDGTVTLRDRDTLQQWRVRKDELLGELTGRLAR